MEQAQVNNEAGIKVSNKTAGSIGLFGAIAVIIGAVIGIGVFFKNGSIFRNNHGSGLGVLLSWIIAFVIALATAYSFVEVVSVKTKSVNAGLGAWSTEFGGNRIGRFVRLYQPIMYYGLTVVFVAVFAAEAILNIFAPGNIDYVGFWSIALIAAVLIIGFTAINTFLNRLGNATAKSVTIIKFIPIIAVVMLGIIFGSLHPGNNIFNSNNHVYGYDSEDKIWDWDTGKFSGTGMLTSLPAVLFAFDAFLIVGNVSSRVSNAKRNVPLSIVISMIASGTIYLLVTISQIISGCTSPYELFDFIFGAGSVGSTVGSIVISVFILIAILGVLNSVSMALVSSSQTLIEDNLIAGSKWFNKINNRHYMMGGFVLAMITAAVWWLIVCVPSFMLDTDQIADSVSNFSETFIYTIYAVVILLSLINRRKQTVIVTKSKGQLPIGIVAIIGCFLAAGYCVFYSYSFQLIEPNDAMNESHSGLFLYSPWKMLMWQETIVFWSVGLFMVSFPFINDLIIKKTDKAYHLPFVWEKVSKISFEIVPTDNETKS